MTAYLAIFLKKEGGSKALKKIKPRLAGKQSAAANKIAVKEAVREQTLGKDFTTHYKKCPVQIRVGFSCGHPSPPDPRSVDRAIISRRDRLPPAWQD
jgi:hypothetical protein